MGPAPIPIEPQLPLSIAAWRGDLKEVKRLIDNKEDVNERSQSYGRSPLHWVWDHRIAELLIKKGADVNVKDSGNFTPLSLSRNYKIAKLLIENGAQVNIPKNRFKKNVDLNPSFIQLRVEEGLSFCPIVTPTLMKEIEKTRFSFIQLRVEEGVSFCPVVTPALMKEIEKTRFSNKNHIINRIIRLRRLTASVMRMRNGEGFCFATTLFPRFRRYDSYLRFKRFKEDLRRMPLVSARSLKIAKLLVEKGAEIDDNRLLSYILISRSIGLFIKEQNKLNPNKFKREKSYIFDSLYVYPIKYKIIKFLLTKGVDVNAKDEQYGRTPLHWWASKIEDPKLAQILIDKGADVNARDHDGRTPLHLIRGRPKIAKFLIKKGADPYIKDIYAVTPVDQFRHNPEMLHFLKAHEAKKDKSPSKRKPKHDSLQKNPN